jgi:hypothetical protein
LFGKGHAAFANGLIEILNRVEAFVGERFVDELPEMLGWLQFGAVSRLEDEPDAIGHGEFLRAMPARPVNLKHDALLLAGANRLGEIGENELEQFLRDSIRDVPHRTPRRRLNEAGYVEPLEAMMPERNWPLTLGRPNAARDRLQADAVLIGRPDLDRRVRMFALFCRCSFFELFFSSARSFSVAVSGCCGRGCWIV